MTISHNQQRANIPFKHRMLARLMPLSVRRAVFVSSLAAFLRGIEDTDKELEDKITSLFDLTYRPSTLRFPMQLHNRIWTDLDNPINETAKAPCSDQIQKFCDKVIAQTPSYLRYGTTRAMRADVFKLLRQALQA